MKRYIVLFFCTVLVLESSLYANWGGGGSEGNFATGSFHAFGTSQIIMEKEFLTIELFKSYAHVSVEYVLDNPGEETVVRAGFPYLTHKRSKFDLGDYSIKINGESVKYKIVDGGLYDWEAPGTKPGYNEIPLLWLVSEVIIPRGKNTKVNIEYESPYLWSYDYWSDDTQYNCDQWKYLLSTGATWKNKIKEVYVKIIPRNVKIDDIIIRKPQRRYPTERPDILFYGSTKEAIIGHKIISPTNVDFLRDGKTIEWEYKELEPSVDDDIIINLNNAFVIKWRNLIGGYKIPEEIRQLPGEFTIEDNEQDCVINFYNDIITATASSELTHSQSPYAAGNIIDGKKDTAWVEGVEGDGIGEYVELEVDKPQFVTQIGIIPGYAKSKDIYFKNNRVAKLKIVLNNEYEIENELVDEFNRFNTKTHKDFQLIDVGPYEKKVSKIRLIIEGVHKGSKYSDTCISEILLRRKLDVNPGIKKAR